MSSIWILSLYFDVSYNILRLKLSISLFFNVSTIFLSLCFTCVQSYSNLFNCLSINVSIIVIYFIFFYHYRPKYGERSEILIFLMIHHAKYLNFKFILWSYNILRLKFSISLFFNVSTIFLLLNVPYLNLFTCLSINYWTFQLLSLFHIFSIIIGERSEIHNFSSNLTQCRKKLSSPTGTFDSFAEILS